MVSKTKKIIIVTVVVGVLLLATTTAAAATLSEAEIMKRSRRQFEPFINYIIDRWEGDYENNANDRGGETRWGITEKDYPNLNIRTLSKAAAIEIYWTDYWAGSKAFMIAPHLQFMHFGGIVNFGVTGQTKVLQRAAGVDDDGKVGMITIAASYNVSPETLFEFQKKRYDAIVANDETQRVFYRGWINRITDMLEKQLEYNAENGL
jgi:lysozyme family protein